MKTESLRNISVVNREAYNQLADDCQERWRLYLEDEAKVLEPFEKILRETFEGVVRVLDVGCGVGLNSHLLSEHGFKVTGVDFAQNMANHAKINAPKATIEHRDLMDIGRTRRFEGVVAMAFLHLFPKVQAARVVRRIRSMLVEEGFGLLATTVSNRSEEGYFEKAGYGSRVKRFRKFWTQEEFLDSIENGGFEIADATLVSDSHLECQRLNVIAKKVP